jgi:DNA-binding XRE family transcriptional regulator
MTDRERYALQLISNLKSWGFTAQGEPMFGPSMRVLREAAGLGLRETAKALGMTATALSKYERGEIHSDHIKPELSLDEWSDLLDKLNIGNRNRTTIVNTVGNTDTDN